MLPTSMTVICSQVTDENFDLPVRRSHITEDGTQEMFLPQKTWILHEMNILATVIVITQLLCTLQGFCIGEQGEDFGGLRRELFSLLVERIKFQRRTI